MKKTPFVPIFNVTVIALLLWAPHASALKRAPFPNGASLQPIPATVRPNISGNVNDATNSYGMYEEGQQNNQTQEVSPAGQSGGVPDTAGNSEGKTSVFDPMPAILYASIGLLLIAAVIKLKKSYKKN